MSLNKQEVLKRIGTLVDLVMRAETETERHALMQETDALVQVYLSNAEMENPPPANASMGG